MGRAANKLLITLFSGLLPIASLYAQGAGEMSYDGTTPWGDPDLQGLWTNDTITPMERPASLQGRAYLTEDEIAAMEQNLEERRTFADDNIEVTVGGNVGGYNQVWLDSGDTVLSTGQTSLIVDPPNGRAPLRESAAAVRDYYFAHVEDDYIYNTVWDRCLTRGVPGSMLPAGYNNAYRFIQTFGVSMIAAISSSNCARSS